MNNLIGTGIATGEVVEDNITFHKTIPMLMFGPGKEFPQNYSRIATAVLMRDEESLRNLGRNIHVVLEPSTGKLLGVDIDQVRYQFNLHELIDALKDL